MLDGLDHVDWGSLRHAYGQAADVPDLLRALSSSDPAVREGAIYDLFGNIWHQGTVYPATAAAVPFLYELLAAPEVQDKSQIAYLLASVATGTGYLEVHAASPFGESTWRTILAKESKTLGDGLAREAAEVNAVRAAVSAGLKGLEAYLTDGESEVRWTVAAAFGTYAEHAAWSLPALEAAAAVESNEEARETMNESIAILTRR